MRTMSDPACQPDRHPALRLRLTGDRLAVCRLEPRPGLPSWVADAPGFLTVSQAADELSVVCSAAVVPRRVRSEGPFRLLHVIGPVPFDTIGIMATLSGALAASGISILPIATYDTDYVLVRETDVERSLRALGEANCTVEVVETLAGPPGTDPGLRAVPAEGSEAHEGQLANERRTRTEVERVSRLKDDFLGTLSHELRTPLNAVLGWTQVLRRSADPGASGAGLEAIERNARALSHLVDDLLDVSRLVSGGVRLELARVDLVPVLRAALDACRDAAVLRGVALGTEIAEPLPEVVGDAPRLQQVVWNLLSNAVKFTPSGGRVTLRADADGEQVRIVVEDTGRGIASEYLPAVFDRFSQADSSASRLQGGLGLGLAIVRHLVELHGGTVGAESEGIGRGARFTVRLPVRAARADAVS
jgi:signal transduction histidine kinase